MGMRFVATGCVLAAGLAGCFEGGTRLGDVVYEQWLAAKDRAPHKDKGLAPSGVGAIMLDRDGQPQVDVAEGPLSGAVAGETYAFLGVPYAEPPVGELRWRAPQPKTGWKRVRAAQEYGKRCAQAASAVLMNAASEDEDCLYLNVWTPRSGGSEPKAVMFWIHGGGNVNGSASEPVPYTDPADGYYFYEGRSLAEQDVVVVSINYRLGVFGFFSHPELAAEGGPLGNQGLLDQQAALHWVQDNIAAFGGDPERVTIFGESAGSLDVCLHVASPTSEGLFSAAISQSGGCTTTQREYAAAEGTAAMLSERLDCSGDGELACLRQVDTASFFAGDVLSGLSFGAVVDDEFMPEQPAVRYDNGTIADVPYMLGSNSDEGTLFIPPTLELPDEQALTDLLAATYGPAGAEALLQLYPLADFGSPKEAYARMMGDARLVCTTYDTALRAQAADRSVYMYNFDIPAPVEGLSGIPLGATHGAELVYVFGTSTIFDDVTGPVSALMQQYWSQFAKTGDPNGGDAPLWPSFSATQNVRMNFSTMPAVVEDFRSAQCAFWRQFY